MSKARLDFQESLRPAELERQLADWEHAARIRAYCDALAAVDDEQNRERASWIAWARTYADGLDPCGRRDVTPA